VLEIIRKAEFTGPSSITENERVMSFTKTFLVVKQE
jgi:hypothetical protein